jgi:uncharacterized protein (DUF1800 family)
VVEVARAFTGWTHTMALPPTLLRMPVRLERGGPAIPARFRFDSTAHDAEAKTVLGRPLPSGRGVEDGEDVLDLLARHPSTARFIARKLAVRLVSDAPPDALVDRAAATFVRTDGDIREVVRTIVTSREFRSPAMYGAKLKTPLELVLSIRRALDAAPDTDAEMIDFLVLLEQPPFGHPTPEGWPETAGAWLGAGAMRFRVDLAMRVAMGEVSSIPVQRWPAWTRLVDRSFDEQLEGVIDVLLGGRASPVTRAAMRDARPPADGDAPAVRERALRELIGLALASPEFQTR